jgi:hypothetical protein
MRPVGKIAKARGSGAAQLTAKSVSDSGESGLVPGTFLTIGRPAHRLSTARKSCTGPLKPKAVTALAMFGPSALLPHQDRCSQLPRAPASGRSACIASASRAAVLPLLEIVAWRRSWIPRLRFPHSHQRAAPLLFLSRRHPLRMPAGELELTRDRAKLDAHFNVRIPVLNLAQMNSNDEKNVFAKMSGWRTKFDECG